MFTNIDRSLLKSRHILLDCDGVLLNYLGGFVKFCGRYGITPSGESTSWDMQKWLGVDGETVDRMILAFNEEDEGFGDLEPYEHAVKGIQKLKDSDWSMSIITSATTTAERQKMRRQNLARHFGEDTFTDIVCLDLVRSKEEVLSGYAPSLWVEDNYRNALLGLKAGHQPVMIKHTYNATERKASHEAVIWTDGLDQIAEGILEAERLAKAA